MSAGHPIHTAEQVLERLAGLPGGPELLAQARRREDVALVGGAVRDLLLGHWPRELDVTVADDAAGLAREIAASVSPGERAYGRQVEPVIHDRFATASVAWQYGRVDIAERRGESYPLPGALPEVRPGSFEEDLRRRDFTVNAIALPLHGAENEGLIAVDDALEDLRAGVLRVLHEQSFIEDPTRILRLGRYATRLGFEIEPATRDLAEQALAEGALETVSGGRIGAELWLAAREADGRGSLRALGDLGVLSALGVPSPFDDALAQEAEALLPPDGSPEILRMGVALRPPEEDPGDESAPSSVELMERLEFTRQELQAVYAVANGLELQARETIHAAERGTPPRFDDRSAELVAAGGALAARTSELAADTVRGWFTTHRHVKLEIDGNDLIAAGIPEGPDIRRRLFAALLRKREGQTSGREEELRTALELPPETRVEAP